MIDIREVTKAYGETIVLDKVSLSLPAGGLTALVGPNGAGKSTLLSVAARLLPIDSGSITVDGLDVTRSPSDALARKLAILRQENTITPRLTVAELVGFGRYPHSKGRPTPEDRDKIEAAIRYAGLEGLATRQLDELSGGQRQRAFIAMVLAQDPDCLLLDEPLNNLDMKHGVEMMRLLRRAADELGKTVLCVLHDINFAACHADTIVAMKAGRILYAGPPAGMMQRDILRAIYDMDVALLDWEGIRLACYYR